MRVGVRHAASRVLTSAPTLGVRVVHLDTFVRRELDAELYICYEDHVDR